MRDDDPASPADPAANGWRPIPDIGFIDHVGPVYYRGSDGGYAFRAAEKHANLINVVHGGMLMSFADRALGETARRAAGTECVTIQMEMQFIDAVRIGDWVEAMPELVRRTGSLAFMRCDLRDGERLVATATGVWKLLRDRPAEG